MILSPIAAACLLLTPYKAQAQSSGPTISESSCGYYSTGAPDGEGLEQCTYVYGDISGLGSYVETDGDAPGLYVVEVGAEEQVSSSDGVILDTGMQYGGQSWNNEAQPVSTPVQTYPDDLVPQPNFQYTFQGEYSYCYDFEGGGQTGCGWQEAQNGPSLSATVTVPGVQGFIGPKYKVMGIVYTVPGTQSSVKYTNTTMMGTSTDTSGSFSVNETTSESFCGQVGGGVCGTKGLSITGTYTQSFTQESDTSSSYAVNQTTSLVNQWNPLTGPALDHGNDVIYVWVNPLLWYTVTPGAPLQWNGYSYDMNDDSNNMEVIPLRLSQLFNPSTIDSFTMGRLQRQWAQTNTTGSSGAITNQDLLNIAALDPFSDPNYTVTMGPDYKTTADGRFTQTTNQELWYQPGSSPQYQWSYSATTTNGQGGKTTNSSEFSLEEKNNNNAFIAAIGYDFKQSVTLPGSTSGAIPPLA